MDMPETYYWVMTGWTLYLMLKELCAWVKRRLRRKRPKPKRKRRKGKRRK